MWSTSAGGHIMKVVNLTGFTVHANQYCVVLEVSDNGLALYGNSINNYPLKCSYQNQNTVWDSVRKQVDKALISYKRTYAEIKSG